MATGGGGSSAGTPLNDEDAENKIEVLINNLLSVGQWEAVRAHLVSLARCDNGGHERAKHILKSILLNPKGFWNQSYSIPSHNHLALLALQTYYELFPKELEGIPSAIQQKHEFNLLLDSSRLCEGYSPQISEWLQGYHETHCIGSSSHSLIPLHTFHVSVQQFLRSVLQSDPSLGHVLINFLIVKDKPHYTANNEILQSLYVDCIDIYWDELEKLARKTRRSNSNEMPVNGSEWAVKANEWAEKIHAMLSLIDPQPEMSRLIKRIDSLQVKLLQSNMKTGNEGTDASPLFTFPSLYSCFVGRSCPILIQRFQDIEEYMKGSTYTESEGGSGPHGSSEERWRREFYRALRDKQHFMEGVLDAGLKAISNGRLEELDELVQDPMLSRVKPLLLLLGWDRYPDIGSGQKLLDILWPQSKLTDPLLFSGCCKLAFQVGLVQWCLQKARPFLPSSPSPHTQSASDMFQGLKNHSILYVLHHSTPLSSLNPLEVIDILKLRPDSSVLGASLTPPRPATPPSESSVTSPLRSTATTASLQPEQERDINIFRAFSCLRLILEGIWHSVLLSNGIHFIDGKDKVKTEKPSSSNGTASPSDKPRPKVVRKLDLGEVDTPEEESLVSPPLSSPVATQSEQLYVSEVMKYLEQAKAHLSTIFPLHFRLEVLENIYSLLFLSSDDIQAPDDCSNDQEVTSSLGLSQSHSSEAENEQLSSSNSIAFIRKQQGFLVDERTAREILLLLNDSMFELTAAKFSLLSTPTKGAGLLHLPGESIISSITPAQLKQRAARLQKQVNEAKWRLELVSSKTGISSEGAGSRPGYVSSDESASDVSEHEDEPAENDKGPEPTGKSLHKTRSRDMLRSNEGIVKGPSPILRQSRPGETSRSGRPKAFPGNEVSRERSIVPNPSTDEIYESSGHCADIEERSPFPSRSKRKKNRSRLGSGSSKPRKLKSSTVQKGSGIIYQMLASPSSLLCKCLRHGNYLKAREVIKMFGLENGIGDSLVQFSEQFEMVSRDLVTQSRSPTPRPSPSSLTPDPTSAASSVASGLQVAIMNASDNSPILDSLHHLLMPTTLSKMLFAGNEELDHTVLDMPLLHSLQDNVPSLVMLDLLIGNKVEGHTAKKIVNLAVERSKYALESLSPRLGDNHVSGRRSFQERRSSSVGDKPLKGPLSLLHILSEVSGYFLLSVPMTTPPLASSRDIVSPHALLTRFLFPLRVDMVQQAKEFAESYSECRDRVEGVVDRNTACTDALELLSQTTVPAVAHRGKDASIFNELSSVMRLLPQADGGGESNQEGVSYIQYLYYLNAYLSKFVRLLRNSLGLSTDEVSPSQMLSVIHESPTELIGRLVFEKNISPQRLEQFMSDLPHLKIVEVIVKCCCPVIPNILPKTGSEPFVKGTIIALNDISEERGIVGNSEENDPCALSHKLLSKMLETLKGLSQSDGSHIGIQELLTALKRTEMKKVLSCTAHLASISLSSLQNDTNREIAFFSNVTNLLYAHAILYIVQETGDDHPFPGLSLNALQSDKFAQMAYFSRVGYIIGELGLISLYDLHYSLLRQNLSPPVLDRDHKVKLRPPVTNCSRWLKYAPSQPDPRVLYVICTGTFSSPVPRLLLPEHVHSELDTAESKYLKSNVSFDNQKFLVQIPKLLDDHRNDFIPRKSQYPPANPYRHLSNVALIRYVISKLPKEAADQLTQLLDSCDSTRRKPGNELKVEVLEEELSLGYDFPPMRRSTLGDGTSPQLPRRPHASPRKQLRRYTRIKPYSFTEDTMSFVRQQAPLLASLVSLLCPPDGPAESPPLELSNDKDFLESVPATYDLSDEPKKAFMQTITFRRSKIRQVPELKRSHSTSDESKVVLPRPSPVWQKTFERLLLLFDDGSPLKRFFVVRLECFKGLLSWDKFVQEMPGGGGEGEGEGGKSESSVNLRKLAVLPGNSPEVAQACSFVLRKLLRHGMIAESVKFLRNEPLLCNMLSVQPVIDLVCNAALVYEAKDEVSEAAVREHPPIDPLVLIYTHSDNELAAQLALASLEAWPVTTCVNILMYISCHLPVHSSFVQPVDMKLRQLYVYQKITEKVERHSGGHAPWHRWSDLSYDSVEKKDEVLNTLLKYKEFDLAREWSEVHCHGDAVVKQIEEEHIFHLLEGVEEPDPYTAQSKLEDLPSNAMKLQICENLLERCNNLQSIMLVLQFLLGRLSFQIPSREKIRLLTNQLLGVKSLLCLPHFVWEQYRPLMRKPLLIIEQLLIDLKIEWVGKVIKALSEDEYLSELDIEDQPVLRHTPTVLSEQAQRDNPFLISLMFYAEKALEFPAPSLSDDTLSRATSPTAPSTPAFTRPYERVRSPSEAPSMTPTPRHRRGRSGSFTRMYTSEKAKYSRYEPPPNPPKKEEWNTDNYCQVCRSTYFGMFSRRHNCRRCGRVVCKPCSTHFMSVAGYSVQQRVCRDCYDHHLLISGSSDEHTMSDQEEEPPCLSSQYPWQLLPGDPHYNENLRTEFYYDESPSTTLCLAVIDLISDIKTAAGFILHCCHNVSMQLVPDNQGRVNEEIDHYFTISIMETLLLNAKLKFIRAEDSSGVELCDTYLSRVDLLRLLVSSRYSEIPSIQELTRPELARRVRDRLIADDRYELAMEVSTKCQLETNTVWTAWGIGCIKAGEFSSARDKFHHCLQSGVQSSGSSFLLERIVEQILSSPLASVKQSDDWSETVKNTLALSEIQRRQEYQRRQENAIVDSRRFQECRYYLKTYGTPAALVSFLGRHHCWFEACQLVREKLCSPDVFLEQLWLPALKSGQLEQLEESLLLTDSSLNTWEQHLTAVCRFLSQRKLFYILYHTQLFMKDYVRAAMTCIKFYIGFSGHNTTIEDLHDRKNYLTTAQEHFQSAIEARQPKGKRFGGSSRQFEESVSRGGTRSMSVNDMQTHINTICLQIRITELLYRAAKAEDTLSKPVPATSSGGEGVMQPATLFSSGLVRGEVTCHMLVSCPELNEGFQIAYEIIHAYRLPSVRVFTEVAKQLALKERYVDVRQLIQCIQKSELMSPELNDEVCLAAIKVLAGQTKEARTLDKHLDKLVMMLMSEKNKVKGLIQCGKLKNAYLVAIKAKLPEEVERIADAAARAGQIPVRDICEKWLQQYRTRSLQQ